MSVTTTGVTYLFFWPIQEQVSDTANTGKPERRGEGGKGEGEQVTGPEKKKLASETFLAVSVAIKAVY